MRDRNFNFPKKKKKTKIQMSFLWLRNFTVCYLVTWLDFWFEFDVDEFFRFIFPWLISLAFPIFRRCRRCWCRLKCQFSFVSMSLSSLRFYFVFFFFVSHFFPLVLCPVFSLDGLAIAKFGNWGDGLGPPKTNKSTSKPTERQTNYGHGITADTPTRPTSRTN